jgi:predicted dehydrogenase
MRRSLHGALVGFGFIAEKGHAPEYRRLAATGGVEIRAVADVTESRRRAALEAFPGARVYASYGELLAREAEMLDFVDVTTPPYAHAEVAEAALSLGLHVLCEKPLAVSPSQAMAMAARASEEKRVLFPCHNYRHAPVVEEVRSILRKDVIGPVRLATLQTFRTTHARGVVDWRPDWRREHAFAGGGIAMDHGSHTFYLAFEWLRSYPTSVTAKMGTIGGHDTEDNFSCSLTFPTGLVTAHLTWTSGARKVLYTLHGPRGAITVDDDVVSVHRVVGATGASSELVHRREVASRWMDASHQEWFGRLFDDFRRAIRDRDYVSDQTLDAIQCIQTIGAAYRSAAGGSAEVAIADPTIALPAKRLAVAGTRALGTLG